ncbi:hypothetical protein N7508_000238 [Penicillium antarcticum]|uniref:uncharacterized protein n=1 Tax=Penicillium antarcticum TaxID=416450 RepID=UPI0023A4496B|nr:uncharacterized protein N7508_000238 [Penicillium antarcticum]KAJ5319955.1 hypothetical protein N7508_000238 [Penicillium antarcticum]
MPWPRFGDVKSVFDLVATILTILGVWYGVFKAQWQLSLRRSTGRLGNVCCDKEQMGYFYPEVPSRKRQIFPFFIKDSKIPTIPTVAWIMKAGDEGVFTSSMFNWITRRQAQVSWRPLYESLFREIEFNRARSRQTPRQDMSHELERYASHARLRVTKQISIAKEGMSKPSVNFAYNETKLWRRKRLHLPCFHKDGQAMKIGADRFIISIHEDSKCVKVDRQFMYAPWKIAITASPPSKKSYSLGNDEEVVKLSWGQPSPILVKSARPLKYLTDTRQNSQCCQHNHMQNPMFANCLQRLWIDEDKPCVEVSEEEMAALAFTLGINMKCPNYQPEGTGAFNIAMSSRVSGCLTKFRLVYSGGWDPGSKACGSGYSTLYAKHLACGCLPFAMNDAHVQTIAIDDGLYQSIKRGRPIVDAKSQWTFAMYYLNRLPRSRGINFYHQAESDGEFGSIYNWEHKVVGKWWEAVSGIAFGGLVPSASKAAADAIAFSVGQLANDQGTELLRRLILEVNEKSPQAIQNMKIFGTVNFPLWRAWADKKHGLQFGPDPTDSITRKIVELFALYCTLLERMMACISYSSNDPVEGVFRDCSEEIRLSYTRAVKEFKPRRGLPTTLLSQASSHWSYPGNAQSIEEQVQFQRIGLDAELNHLVQKIRVHGLDTITSRDCAKVARCIISEWARLVRDVRWNESGIRRSSDGIHNIASIPVPLSDLPDTSLWE